MDALDAIYRAAELIASADGILITAGAGMSIDSKLPDYRGPGGFWNAYPALGRKNMNYADIATPHVLRNDPQLAWGFHGHQMLLYRQRCRMRALACCAARGTPDRNAASW